MAIVGDKLRFYGAEGANPKGNFLWWASIAGQGATWSDYTATNIPGPLSGKDPGVLLLADGA